MLLEILCGGLLALRALRLLLGLQPGLLGTALGRSGLLARALRLFAPFLDLLRLPFAQDVQAMARTMRTAMTKITITVSMCVLSGFPPE